jgi:3-dehydroquinate synthase
MAHTRSRRVFLTGFSGSGKSTVAALVASRMGWTALDTDRLIVEREGRSVADIFEQDGEQHFRMLEAKVLRECCEAEDVVVSCGGGVPVSSENRRLLAESGVIVCMEARPETLYERLNVALAGERRPLLESEDGLGRIRDLKARRQPYYALADATVHTDGLSPEQVAEDVVRAAERVALPRSKQAVEGMATPDVTPVPLLPASFPGSSCLVTTPNEHYPVYVGWGALDDLGKRLSQLGLSGRVWLVTDENVRRLYGEQAVGSIRSAGLECETYAISPGEASKSLDSAAQVFDWLITQRAERRDTIVALGGGVVGDLAGYAAATYLRGIAFVQAPTSLLAMVDASVGGKVAVNHREGKNLIGAFYQPRMVLADAAVLATLPVRELREGWAEAIKHAMIFDRNLLETFERNADRILALDPEIATPVVERSIALKGLVVSRDPKETGLRMVLNYGHTIGHALEAATEYGRLLHGEAVAVGMMGAAEISCRMALLSRSVVDRQRTLLQRYGLPIRAPAGIDVDRVIGAMSLDKKVSGKAIRWILLRDIGETEVRNDVPLDMVRSVVEELLAD